MTAVRVLLPFFAAITTALTAFQSRAEESQDERWNVYGQSTYTWFRKNAFSAPYTNFNGTPNSLVPEKERTYTFTATLYTGLQLSRNTDFYFVPEIISELPLSGLHGLASSIQNGELEKGGTQEPTLYHSRVFIRHTHNLGGTSTPVESAPMQLPKSVDSRRFVLTAGNFAIIDVFDKNAYAGDTRQQFANMSFLTYGAFDFEADARGYTWGVAGEYYYDDWAFRAGRFVGPKDPNQLPLNDQFWKYYGDNFEIEHAHKILDRPGKTRVLLYHNVAKMGRWDDAINALQTDPSKNAAACTSYNYNSSNSSAPDMCWVRRRNSKVGIGISLEQSVTPDLGMFLRAMKSDGKTEVYAYTATDSSLSFGALAQGGRWGRGRDSTGIGYSEGRISGIHQTYMNMGGVDAFIGDGKLNYKPERLFEVFYNINLHRYFWLTVDYQHIANPAYNADRGPVTLYGLRLHAEF